MVIAVGIYPPLILSVMHSAFPALREGGLGRKWGCPLEAANLMAILFYPYHSADIH
jgi:hypothetical protein